jgi:hypothetical protein
MDPMCAPAPKPCHSLVTNRPPPWYAHSPSHSAPTSRYGDILPVNHVERTYVLILIIVGAMMFSYCVGSISALASKVSEAL